MPVSQLTDANVMCFVATAKPELARRFYGETLSLTFRSEDPFGLVFTVNRYLTLRLQIVNEFEPQKFTVMGWEVENLAQVVADLSQRGVRFEHFGFPSQDERGICTFETGDQVAWFKDPEGNMLSVAQLARS